MYRGVVYRAVFDLRSHTKSRVGWAAQETKDAPMTVSVISRIQNFFLGLCDGEWEHGEGLKIETLDNPGWQVIFDLDGTELGPVTLPRVCTERGDGDWVDYWKNDHIFHGTCGPQNLEELLSHFLEWAERAIPGTQYRIRPRR
jgi:immunity protein 53 of polymorphic toxin system